MNLKRSIVLLSLVFVYITTLVPGAEPISEEKWVVYQGEFASFLIRWDFEINHARKDTADVYTISNPRYPDSKLHISNGHKDQTFHLTYKDGYRVQEVMPASDNDRICYGKKGTDSKGFNWREIYIVYFGRGAMGPVEDRIYIVYEGAPGELSRQFDKIISSLKVKDNVQLDTNPTLP